MTLQGRIFEFYTFGFQTGVGRFSGSLIKNLALFFSYDLRVEAMLDPSRSNLLNFTFFISKRISGVFGSLIKNLALFFSYDLRVEAMLDPSRSNF